MKKALWNTLAVVSFSIVFGGLAFVVLRAADNLRQQASTEATAAVHPEEPTADTVILLEDLHVRVMNPDGISGYQFGDWCIAKEGEGITVVDWLSRARSSAFYEYTARAPHLTGECPSGTFLFLDYIDMERMRDGKAAWNERLVTARNRLRAQILRHMNKN